MNDREERKLVHYSYIVESVANRCGIKIEELHRRNFDIYDNKLNDIERKVIKDWIDMMRYIEFKEKYDKDRNVFSKVFWSNCKRRKTINVDMFMI